jgi:hypothetical protein
VTFTYDGPGASTKDEVRFLIGDTDAAAPYMSDEEINYLIGRWMPLYGTVEWVAAMAAGALAGRFAREASYSADGVSIGLGALGQQFRDLSVQLREQHRSSLVGGQPDAGGITPGERTAWDVKEFDFGTGMHDNLEAGRQNYGNRELPEYSPEQDPGV